MHDRILFERFAAVDPFGDRFERSIDVFHVTERILKQFIIVFGGIDRKRS